jgi:hypothetical protein
VWSWWCHPSDNSTYEVISDLCNSKMDNFKFLWTMIPVDWESGSRNVHKTKMAKILYFATINGITRNSTFSMNPIIGNKTSYIKKTCYWNRCTKTWECMLMYIYLCSGINGTSVFTTFWLDFRTVQMVLY